jgi:hypothetical protein
VTAPSRASWPRRFGTCCLLIAGLGLLAPTIAEARELETAELTTRRSVRLEVLGSAAEAEQLRASLSESFGRIAIELELTTGDDAAGRAPPTASAAVFAQVDLRVPGVATVRLARGGFPLGEPRTVPERGSRTLLLEETALVVYTATESLLNEVDDVAPPPAPVAPAPPVATPPTPVPAPVPPPQPAERPVPLLEPDRAPAKIRAAPTAWSLDAAMLLGVRAYTQSANTVTGFGLGVRGRVDAGRWVPSLWLRGEYHFPFDQTAQGVQLSTSVWSIRVEPSLDLVRRGAFRLELGAGGGADIFVVKPIASSNGAELSPDRHDASGVLSTFVAGSLATSSVTRLVLAVMLDYDLQPRRYLVAQGADSWVVLEPWRCRPALTLGFLFGAASKGRPP